MKTENAKQAKSLRYDLILIGALLVISLGVLLITTLTRREGGYVEVEQSGQIVATYSLSIDGEYSLNGGTNILVIEDGVAYISKSDCPTKDCVGTKISRVGESIVCAYNEISIMVKGETDSDDNEDRVDFVS